MGQITPYTLCVSVNLSKSSFIYQLQSVIKSLWFRSNPISSTFQIPAVDRKGNHVSRLFTARQHSSSYAKRCISYDRFCLTVW